VSGLAHGRSEHRKNTGRIALAERKLSDVACLIKTASRETSRMTKA
jgi:hypothetical protein